MISCKPSGNEACVVEALMVFGLQGLIYATCGLISNQHSSANLNPIEQRNDIYVAHADAAM